MTETIAEKYNPTESTKNYTINDLNELKEMLDIDSALVEKRKLRPLRNNQVRNLTVQLKKYNYFFEPIFLNLNTKTGKYYVIDGQHRINTVIKVLSENPNLKIRVKQLIVKDKTAKEQDEIYDDIAHSAPQSISDFLITELARSDVTNFIDNTMPNELGIATNTGKTPKNTLSLNFQRLVKAFYRAKKNLDLRPIKTPELIRDANAWNGAEIESLTKKLLLFKRLHLGKIQPYNDPYYRTESYMQVFFHLYDAWLERGLGSEEFEGIYEELFLPINGDDSASRKRSLKIERICLENKSMIRMSKGIYEFIRGELNAHAHIPKSKHFQKYDLMRELVMEAE